MDRERIIALVESEIRRKEAQARVGSVFAQDNREAAEALRAVLDAYVEPPVVEKVVEVPELLRGKWVRQR